MRYLIGLENIQTGSLPSKTVTLYKATKPISRENLSMLRINYVPSNSNLVSSFPPHSIREPPSLISRDRSSWSLPVLPHDGPSWIMFWFSFQGLLLFFVSPTSSSSSSWNITKAHATNTWSSTVAALGHWFPSLRWLFRCFSVPLWTWSSSLNN